MLYQAYQAQVASMAPLHSLAHYTSFALGCPLLLEQNPLLRKLSAAAEVFNQVRFTHMRQPFGITSVEVGKRTVRVEEEESLVLPFGTLLHFKKVGVRRDPPVLLVAPMSGHFATLLRETVRTMLSDHDVYITDWHNARDVPMSAGVFGMDEYADYLIAFLEHLGPGANIVAICQPCVAALTAVSIMEEDKNPATPNTLTLMAGPIDCRINPTGVNELARSRSLSWFASNMIATVPAMYPGRMRSVYPGFLQLSAFLSMNLERHVNSFVGMYNDMVAGNIDKAETARAFYTEYFSVLDLTAEFYLDTIKRVFQDYELPRGQLTWHGRPVRPDAIRRAALLTVEGERDDICAIGQTMAAQDLCSSIRPYKKTHHVQTGVGHYGVFSGRRWNQQVYPMVRDVIHRYAA